MSSDELSVGYLPRLSVEGLGGFASVARERSEQPNTIDRITDCARREPQSQSQRFWALRCRRIASVNEALSPESD